MMIAEYTINLENDWCSSLSCFVTFLKEEGFIINYRITKEPRILLSDAQNAIDLPQKSETIYFFINKIDSLSI